jgi:predicted ATPase/DNA-binding CsgD family transcriptional regulator
VQLHNLPLPLASIVGRAPEIEALGPMLRTRRLVTLAGPGGVGKTRLALELARGEGGRRSDGAWLVDLTAGADQPNVAMEVARAFELRRRTSEAAVAALKTYLADRDLLLLLDNCEQVAEPAAQLAAHLLESCPNLTILATSREVLGVEGEVVWKLGGLEPADARRLFVERARQREPAFIGTEGSDVAIGEVCMRVDCLPLGIELAAARVGVMSPAEILASLDTELAALGGPRRVAPAHHQTLRATVDWSYQLLDPPEQEAFRSLSVFVAGFDLDAARAAVPGLSVALLARLVDKSLVAVIATSAGRTRYRLLETVREFAHERLVDAEGLETTRARHLAHFSALAENGGEGWPAPGAEHLLAALAADYENVRAALEWAVASDPCSSFDLLARTKDLFMMLRQADGLRLARLALERCPAPNRERIVVQVTAGVLSILFGDADAARETLKQARELSSELREPALEAWSLFFGGLTEMLEGAQDPARKQLQASRALHHRLGIRAGEARATAALGLTIASDDPVQARDLVEEALSLASAESDLWTQGQCQLYLGMIAEAAGARGDAATAHYRQAVEHLRLFRGGPLLPVALIGQASVLCAGEPAKALRIAAAAYDLRARVGGNFPPFFLQHGERVRAEAEAALGDGAAGIWIEGRRLGMDDAIALAFGSHSRRPQTATGLSTREVDVGRLVANGMSNKEIAAALHLSVRTVESHVRHALGKLGLANRTQLATWTRQRIQ